jgi:hippurate hydrolase
MLRAAIRSEETDVTILDEMRARQAEMMEWRHDIHAHPELGFDEHRTADLVARRLEAFGCAVTRGVGRTGVVGTLSTGRTNRAIGLRADMDALPIQEANSFDYRSRHDGRMHACGHDGHTTSLLGAARYLAETRRFDGTVHFIFQPAEEGIGGARAMIEDGLFARFPCEQVFGYHNAPGLPVGRYAIRPGPMMAGGAFFDITVQGRGAHGARPEASIDPVLTACHVTTALQSIVSRNVKPAETAVLSVTRVDGGDAYNVIPDRATIRGTVRAYKPEVMDAMEAAMRRVATGVAAGFGATVEIDFRLIFAPLVNDAEAAMFMADVAAEIAGEPNVDRDREPVMGSEDFSFMLQAVPGAYMHVGNGNERGACPIHNPNYDYNDEALPYAAALYARLVERRLARA